MENEYKTELDYYFNTNYKQLVKNCKFLIIKSKSKFTEEDLLTETYLYLDKNKDKVITFAEENKLTLNHVLYIFFKRYTTMSCIWKNSDINRFNSKLYDSKDLTILEDYNYNNIEIEDEIYNEEFIDQFIDSLNKEDKICFIAYYKDGYNTYKQLGEYLNISLCSGRNIVKDLNNKMKQYIKINNIH